MNRKQLKDQIYMLMAHTIAKLSTCNRLQVGCILLSKDGRIAGAGYNGVGPGMPHCNDEECNIDNRCMVTMHAEQNALFNCSENPTVAYVTAEPCLNCAKELILRGVRRVVYGSPYRSITLEEKIARQKWIEHYSVKLEEGC